MTFGDFVKQQRIRRGLSLRAFSERCGVDFASHSKLERGLLNPPDDQVWMLGMAESLGVHQNTPEWGQFCDLAAVARREIPKPLAEDAKVVRKLPVLICTAHGERLPPEKMDELIDFVRTRH